VPNGRPEPLFRRPRVGIPSQTIERLGEIGGPLPAPDKAEVAMLRITMHDRPEALTFQVEGRLVGAWAKELEYSWISAAPMRGNRAPIVDLTGILFIDDEGRRVLTKLFREGAFFRTAGPMTESIVSEIISEVTGKSRQVRRSLLVQSLLLVAVAVIAKGAQPDSQPGGTLKLTLRDAVGIALKQNPQVQVANLNLAMAQENQSIAWLFDQASDMQKSGVGTRMDRLRSNVPYRNEQQPLIEARTTDRSPVSLQSSARGPRSHHRPDGIVVREVRSE